MFLISLLQNIIEAEHLLVPGEVFIHPELLQHFLFNKEINAYFFNFEKNYKNYIKRFFDNAETMMTKFLPQELILNLRDVLSELSNIIAGGFYNETEIPCLRHLQFVRNREVK